MRPFIFRRAGIKAIRKKAGAPFVTEPDSTTRESFIHLWIGSKDLSAAETRCGRSVLVDRRTKAEGLNGWMALGLEELRRQQQYLSWNDGVIE